MSVCLRLSERASERGTNRINLLEEVDQVGRVGMLERVRLILRTRPGATISNIATKDEGTKGTHPKNGAQQQLST